MCYRKTPVTKISKREKLGVSAWAPPCYSFIIFFPKLLTLTQGLPWIRLFMMCSSVRAEIVHLLTGKFMAQHVMVNTVTQIGSLVFITEQLRPRHPPPPLPCNISVAPLSLGSISRPSAWQASTTNQSIELNVSAWIFCLCSMFHCHK